MVSPHFPPDSSAASHRVRLLAPYLLDHGWEPTVLTVDPRDYEGGVEPALEALVPASLRVVRSRAWRPSRTRPLGFGDLGLRAFVNLRAACTRLLQDQRFDALFITVYPVYPALMAPGLKRRFGLKFILDYQDPWVGSWGLTVGGGPNGAPDARSRLSRRLGTWLEPLAVRAADAITAVSARTYEEIDARIPIAAGVVREALPLGWDREDVVRLAPGGAGRIFKSGGGDVNVLYVGTILPKGIETLRAVLEAARLVRDRDPEAYARLRLWFLGTSNQFSADAAPRVLPIATELGVSEIVREMAPRIPYADAIAALQQANAILLLGSTEPHYTASKLFPALMADRPILAAFHEASSVVEILTRVGAGSPDVRLVAFGPAGPRISDRVDCLARHLAAITRQPLHAAGLDLTPIEDVSAPRLAGKLCAVLDHISVC
jgi:hypothetical protein